MKALYPFFIFLFCLFGIKIFSQPDNGFKYQAVARINGALMENQPLTVEIEILNDGNQVYAETHTTETNDFGLFSLNVGMGEVLEGLFSEIYWGEGNYTLKVKVNGNDEFPESPILAVPFSLYAQNSGSDADWIVDGENVYRNNGNVGINTDSPSENLNIVGTTNLFQGSIEGTESQKPALRVIQHSDIANPNQVALEVMGGVTDVRPKYFRIYTSSDDPWNLKAELDGLLTIGNNFNSGHTLLSIDDGASRFFQSATSGTNGSKPAVQVLQHSDIENPNQVALEVIGGVTDVQPKYFRVYTSNDDPWNLKARFDGRFKVNVLEIVGGSDITEKVYATESIQPGEVVIIDTDCHNCVKRSTQAYDRRVIGVVSGSGEVNAGLQLGQKGMLDGDTSYAIAGRVYVKITGAVEPSDLLTTSEVPGRAMKARSYRKSRGAIIGKALTVPNADGEVLMQVFLQ